MYWFKSTVNLNPTYLNTSVQHDKHLQCTSNGFSHLSRENFKDLDNFFLSFFFNVALFGPSCLYTYGHVSNDLAIKVFK